MKLYFQNQNIQFNSKLKLPPSRIILIQIIIFYISKQTYHNILFHIINNLQIIYKIIYHL